jgi:hypothetical protein
MSIKIGITKQTGVEVREVGVPNFGVKTLSHLQSEQEQREVKSKNPKQTLELEPISD